MNITQSYGASVASPTNGESDHERVVMCLYED